MKVIMDADCLIKLTKVGLAAPEELEKLEALSDYISDNDVIAIDL